MIPFGTNGSLSDVHKRIVNCSFHRPCNKPTCDHCGGGKPHRRTQSHEYVYEQRADPKQSRGKSKNYRARAGHWMMKPFRGFPEDQVHPFTIDFYIEDRHMDGRETTKRERTKFQSFLKQEMPDAIVRMICDISTCWISTQYLFMPDDAAHPRYRSDNRPSEFGFNFHGHGLIWHPFLSRRKIQSKLSQLYPGRDRVCFGTRRPEKENEQGYLTGGLQGWAEYAGMEKTQVNLTGHDPNNDNYSAVQSMLMIRKSWRRSARKITFNDKLKDVIALQKSLQSSTQFIAPSMVPDDEILDETPKPIPSITSIGVHSIQ